ncbi:centrosome-associated protein 350 isoform X2 [Megalops cyprinoides]|uniref:centrosome-associated protein 350 isoform X2 n=1 Tax=Megalops cyprinoides TaxID=118141 RepID=UPI001863CBFA|nr:centrosome-associated protein 350 isoform X2 [Megalops cyprinoides]
MWSRKRSEAPLAAPAPPAGLSAGRELSAAWTSLNQTKAALRHIENRLEAVPGTGVLLDSVMDTKKTSSGSTRKVSRREGRHMEDTSLTGSASKSGSRSRRSPDKSSRSPLRTTTLDSNVGRANCVDFRDPLASYREMTPPPLTSSQLEAQSLLSQVPCSSHEDARLSQLVYQRDTRDQQTRDLDSTRSSALDSTVVRYLNDRPVLDALRRLDDPAGAGCLDRDGTDGRGKPPAPEASLVAETTQSSSPGSTSQRLENLRRRQPDDKLEKLKERIRRQREHLEEAAERDKLLGYLQQPVGLGGGTTETTTAAPTAKVRKVAAAPPAPIYKGFNPSETKIRTPDGKVWREEEFQNLSRDMYRDLSLQLAEHAKSKRRPAEKGKEKKPPKPVRKVHKSVPLPAPDSRPVAPVTSTSSWWEGQKPARAASRPAQRPPREPRAESADRATRTGPPRANSEPRLGSSRQSRASSTERPRSCAQSEDQTRAAQPTPVSAGPEESEGKALNTDILSADIRGILDDLQLEGGGEGQGPEETHPGGGKPAGPGARARPRAATGAPSRVSRSASPAKSRQEPVEAAPKKRHYDAESVRQYIARQQEERKRKQQEERRAQREEAERRSKRLQELYRKQREGMAKGQVASEGPAQKRLQETYTKLFLEQARLGEELPQALPTTESLQPKPVYQPSGESDKENKRLDRPQSASSSSDLSLSEPQAGLLTRNELGRVGQNWMQPDRLSPAGRAVGSLVPPTGHLFTQLLGLEPGISGLKRESQAPVLMGGANKNKMNRIEALKATAASLSSRIESEARKLAGAGINYDCARDAGDVVTGLPAQPHDDGRWAKPVSPPVHEGSEPDDIALRIQRLLSAGHTTYNGVLPGVGNLHSFRGLKDRGAEEGRAHTAPASAGLGFRNYSEERQGARANVSEAGKNVSVHDSSRDSSISEGPLLSEGSLSEGDGSPQASTKGLPKPAAHLRAPDFCAGEQDTFRHIAHFQKEAEKYPALSSVSQTLDSRSPWEELAKGSPHSVINIFTKNLNNYSKVMEEKMERSSPALRSAQLASPMDVAAYEDDFVSSSSNGGSRQSVSRGLAGISLVNGLNDELASRRSPYDIRAGDLPSLHSSGSTPVSSPRSAGSVQKRASEASADSLDRTLVDRQRSPPSQASEPLSRDSQRDGTLKSSSHSLVQGADADSPLRALSAQSPLSLVSDGRKSPRSPALSPSRSPTGSGCQKASVPAGEPSPAECLRTASSHPSALPSSASSSSSARARPAAASSAFTRLGAAGSSEPKLTGELHYAPSALQQRMAAELSYLDAMEESVRQLADVERLRGVSLAQQESVSLAQILKSQQQRHERDLFLLKQKAEQEALETKRQLEETRQQAARAHAELQGNMVQSKQEALGGLQDAASRMLSQQAEAVRYTTDAARHIKEMTELARSQIAGALSVPAAPITTLYDQQRQQHQSFMKQLHSSADTDSRKIEGSVRSEEPLSSLGSPSESSASRGAAVSHSNSSIHTRSSLPSLEQKDGGAPVRKDKSSSSVAEEAHTAADDSARSGSIPSLLDEKDNTSIATDYSLKFDESMTEDEIEERSFRSLLPSEAHLRSTLKGSSHEDSEEERGQEKSSVPEAAKQEGSMSFSGGQHSFSRFTMDMVRQYMKEEEVRAQHQSSLLRLREKALKEKTKAELAWLEHQKRRLRDKGEDDKMPPIRKKQRGLLLRLQQEQAEIKRLQEANRAARKERLLLLKQQEEIERMRHTTLKLKERLKSAGETNLEPPVSEPAEEAAVPSSTLTDLDTPSPSPMSVSGSETSSIMEKLKKMRCHMDEKHCSPVHYFFSVFTAHHWASLSVCFPNLHPKFQLFIYNQLVRFLTKREQQLMQRRRHAEELLEWKQRLDAEEAEVRRMEKQALAAWDGERHRDKPHRSESSNANANATPSASIPEDRMERELRSKSDYSPVATVSSQHSESSVPEELGSPSTDHPISELPSPHKDTSQQEDTIYTQEFDSSSEIKQSPSPKASLSTSRHPESSRGGGSSGGSKLQLRSSARLTEPWSSEARSVSQSEPTSDQSDIESRIHALKEELRKRKSIVYQLKKEQKKRQKERLKAQEASLLKQLESYNDFIQKTKAELSKEPDTTPTTKPQIKTPTSATEKPKIKPPPLQRPETSKNWRIATETDKGEKGVQPDSPIEHVSGDVIQSGYSQVSSLREEGSSDEDPPTVTPTPVQGSPEHNSGLKSLMSPELLPGYLSKNVEPQDGPARPQAGDSGDESVISSQRSEVVEELELLKSEESDNDSSHLRSDHPLKLDLELRPLSQQHSLKESLSSEKSESGFLRDKGLSRSGEKGLKDSVDGAEEIRPGEPLTNELKSATKEPKEHQSSEISSSKRDVSYTPDFDIPSPDKEALVNLKEDSVPLGDSYHDDFESSVELSHRESYSSSKPASPAALQTEARPNTRSPVYSSEEEISEVLSEKYSSASGSFHSEKLLDLKTHSKISIDREEHDKDKEDAVCPGKSPVTSRPQSPPSPTLDVMPDFSIGDRVLVSNVQPGTLRFKGKTNFANGFWAGVELDKSEGSNNGTYDGVMYFECEEGHGIFAPPDKISRLPENFEIYVDTTEDEDSFYDDQSDGNSKKKLSLEKQLKLGNLQDQKEEKSVRGNHSGEKGPSDVSETLGEHSSNEAPPEKDHFLKSTVNVEFNDSESKSSEKLNGDKYLTPNGRSRNIILDFEDATTVDYGLLITEVGRVTTREQTVEKASTPLLDLLAREKNSLAAQQKSSLSDVSSTERAVEKSPDKKMSEKENVGAFAERLLNNFVQDAVTQFQQIKKARDEKILASNRTKENDTHEEENSPESLSLHPTQRDNLPIFTEDDQEEVSSPELCTRPESPVLGASGQEELAKRLAELELSRELMDALGDEPDWFDEDFGLSSRKEQQKQRSQQHKEGVSRPVCVVGEDQVKTPARPEPPQQAKVTEEPVMVVPHTAPEVEKLVHAATQEIWKCCNLSQGLQTLSGVPRPLASDDFLGSDTQGQDQESISNRSYRKAVFDLTWEIIQEIFSEDPNIHQPQWMKPRRMNPSCFRRVKSPADMSKIQAFITTEVLKLYGLKKDQNQKTDWQKMLKFGRKKRDRVDHILVQELHEEESQWVNYDEDELFVKMQLADGIFDALVKDTADVLLQIQERRAKRALP